MFLVVYRIHFVDRAYVKWNMSAMNNEQLKSAQEELAQRRLREENFARKGCQVLFIAWAAFFIVLSFAFLEAVLF